MGIAILAQFPIPNYNQSDCRIHITLELSTHRDNSIFAFKISENDVEKMKIFEHEVAAN